MAKYNIIDLFSGCGGLLDGFMQSGKCNHIASVEWELAPVKTLRKRLKDKWNDKNSDVSVIHFDIQRFDELFNGFNDKKYGSHIGLTKVINGREVDFIIGGPPCQAYSVASRISNADNMDHDYRNFLFEYYLKIVKKIKPKLFVFENVPGMLTAKPGGKSVIELIKKGIKSIGYEIIDDIKEYAVVDAKDFGVPQARKRVILLGLNKKYFSSVNIQSLLIKFYTEYLPKYKVGRAISVKESIGDLPLCKPYMRDEKPSHLTPICEYTTWHIPRYASLRDVKVFKKLTEDIESGRNEFVDSNKLKEMYAEVTGNKTNVHKYHVLRPNEPSTTILAHLYKDGLRFIHYDSKQCRTITPREAARLQSFDDTFDFVGSIGEVYKMIGNAVPVLLAQKISLAINDMLRENKLCLN